MGFRFFNPKIRTQLENLPQKEVSKPMFALETKDLQKYVLNSPEQLKPSIFVKPLFLKQK